MIDLTSLQLLGTKCVFNISSEPQKSKLTMVSTDPRKWRHKPDAYASLVEYVGPFCELVELGDRALIERWEYKQVDVDDERVIGNESQVLVYQKKQEKGWGPEIPAPGVVVMQLIERALTNTLLVPDRVKKEQDRKRFLYFGKVTNSGSTVVKIGDYCWVEKRERHQYRTPDGRLMFINCQDSWGEYPIWMTGTKTSTEEK